MSISANTVFEIRTAGNDTNGGGFVATGTDYSQQDAKNTVGNNISTTDAVAVGTGVITSVTGTFTSAIVGNIIYLQGGTGTLAAGWYQVITFTSATSITVDRNVAAGTGITMNIGGALASPGMAGGAFVSGSSIAGNTFYIKAGTYTVTSASANVTNGCFSTSAIVYWEGYQTTRGDLGTQPLIQASGISTFTLLTATGIESAITNLKLDGATLTSSRGVLAAANMLNVTAINCTNSAIVGSGSRSVITRCQATGCTTQPAILDVNINIDSIAYDNTNVGFSASGANASFIRCIADSNTGASSDGFAQSGQNAAFANCVAYANGRDGFRATGGGVVAENCLAESNTGFGYLINNVNVGRLLNCGTYLNTGGAVSLGTGKFVYNTNAIVGSASFFTNAAGQDFSLNTTAGGGAAARAAGFPGVLTVGGTGYLDLGALQHADPAGGSGASVSQVFGG